MTVAKERPILFSSPMVRAILAGSKTQTRRVAKGVAGESPHPYWPGAKHGGDFVRARHCPHGRVGDRLWVRESFCENYFGDDQVGTARHGYMADWTGAAADVCQEPRWTPSIHMPRWASRLTLEIITEVRVERLQEISEDDAKAEGVAPFPNDPEGDCWTDGNHRTAFEYLWQSINGKRSGCSWAESPWVWVISFKRVEGA